jgi:hypothetical protein
MEIPTVKIKGSTPGSFLVMNESEFVAGKHEVFVDQPVKVDDSKKSDKSGKGKA